VKAGLRTIGLLVLIALWLLPSVCSASQSDYAESYNFIRENISLDEFSEKPIKANRVETIATFCNDLYLLLKGKGDISEGDLFPDKQATVWLIALDRDYRMQGKIAFLKKDPELGITEDRWVSYLEFQNILIPKITSELQKTTSDKAKARADQLAMRILEQLGMRSPLEEWFIIPPIGSVSREWFSLENTTDAELKLLLKETDKAYQNRDGAALNQTLATIFKRAEELAGGNYPSTAMLSLELLNNHFPVLTIAFFLYLLASLALFVWLATKLKYIDRLAIIMAVLGFILQTYSLVVRSIIAGHLPTTSMYEYLALMSWAVVLIYLFFQFVFRYTFIGAIALPIAFVLIVLASLFPQDIQTQLIPALQSWWLTIHVVLASLGEGAFAVGFAAALLYLINGKRPGGKLPSQERLDQISYRAIGLGYPLFTIGALVAGAIWAQQAWGVWWSWDPKEVAALIVWLVASAYLHARLIRGWKGKGAAILAIAIFVLAVLTLFSNLIFGGLHSYNA
jgi:cytochrome c-type biogenesis protein CcsB